MRYRTVNARFAVRGGLLIVAWLAFLLFVPGISDATAVAFAAGAVVAWLWPRLWRWSDGERYERTQKDAPPRQPGG